MHFKILSPAGPVQELTPLSSHFPAEQGGPAPITLTLGILQGSNGSSLGDQCMCNVLSAVLPGLRGSDWRK